jgi:uncharacterized protein YebE (UPF0316 family)
MTFAALLTAGFIFILRVLNYAISTIRTITITRQQKLLASFLAFLEALLFAVVIGNIVKDLDNFLNLMAYCFGAAAGGWVGMVIESRYITSYMVVNVISEKAHAMALMLRDKGYGVTETQGEGRSGPVTMIRSVVENRELPEVLHTIREVEPEAFIAVEEARAIERGWLRAGLNRRQNSG